MRFPDRLSNAAMLAGLGVILILVPIARHGDAERAERFATMPLTWSDAVVWTVDEYSGGGRRITERDNEIRHVQVEVNGRRRPVELVDTRRPEVPLEVGRHQAPTRPPIHGLNEAPYYETPLFIRYDAAAGQAMAEVDVRRYTNFRARTMILVGLGVVSLAMARRSRLKNRRRLGSLLEETPQPQARALT